VYGDIERRLPALAGDLDFEVVSKIEALPARATADAAVKWVERSVARSMDRLGIRLSALLFHQADDLLGQHGDTLWRATELITAGRVRLGVSCYDPAALVELRRRYPIAVAQLPGSALDQRLNSIGAGGVLRNVEI